MILPESIIDIATFNKPHGVNGELSVSVDSDVDFKELKCIVVELDGIFVPFFVESVRPRGAASVLLKIDGINNEKEAMKLARHTIYALKDDVDYEEPTDADGFYAEDMIGFKVSDSDSGEIGEITAVNDQTENILFVVTRADGSEVFIPVAEEMIEDIDPESKSCIMNLPEGLLDL
ncbi:MAG: 16S rRNA processing protein RimM [Bacteroides sp.]|nr:16S rRNA processing protein RimM [Bacteroides sp.]